MRKIEEQMLAAAERCLGDASFEGCAMRSANTHVWQQHSGIAGTTSYHRWIEVILHDTVIALIEPQLQRVSLYTGGWHSRTTSSRIEVILSRFCKGWHVNLSKGQLYLRKESWSTGEREPLKEGRELEICY
jgi:hypothetical protein